MVRDVSLNSESQVIASKATGRQCQTNRGKTVPDCLVLKQPKSNPLAVNIAHTLIVLLKNKQTAKRGLPWAVQWLDSILLT